MNREDRNRLAAIGKLMHETLRLPVVLIDCGRHAIAHAWGTDSRTYPNLSSAADLLLRMTRGDAIATLPVVQGTNFLEYTIALAATGADGEPCLYAIGPVLYEAPAPERIQALMDDNGIPREERDRWADYYRELPVVTRAQLVHIGILLYRLVHGVQLEPHDVLSRALELERPLVRSEQLESQLLARREDATLHHDPYMEERLYDCVRNGDQAGALRMLAAFPEESIGILSRSSHLRNLKNLAIVTVTLTTRAAMDAGMFWELAYTLSDLHIQQIEDLREIRQVEIARQQVVADFAERVRLIRERRVSKAVAACQNYIYNHLFEEIALEDLARLTGLNGNYVSQRFKKETGMSFRGYLLARRIEEARRLIRYAPLSFTEIATRLCFHDQSHFTKAFKKATGMTPKQYREDAKGRGPTEDDQYRPMEDINKLQ
ncbi:helix-turn-helix domain-containing protein [Cohnella sp. GCM10027633]|uniref:helix-turn-helix domain-containing protein n=1 Tax=unclassified Cohnella TaxID=2636738 RepID=UPI0036324ADB